MDYRRVTGALLFIGGAQFLVGMVLAEAVYPGYSISQNYTSDLGVGPAALIFNSSVFLLGLIVLVCAYFVQRVFGNRVFTVLVGLAGVGAMGVGVFPENFGSIHSLVSLVAFLFGGLSAIAAYKFEKSPLTYFSVAMGVLSLIALVLYLTHLFLGLGSGGMERMIAYPILVWLIGFGGYLIGSS